VCEPDNSPHIKTWESKIEELGSSYILSTFPADIVENYTFTSFKSFLPEDITAESSKIFPSDPSESVVNDSIILLVNLARYPHKSILNRLRRSLSPNDALTYFMLEHFRYRTTIQQAGAIRILMWSTQNDKYNVMPRSTNSRTVADLDFQEVYFAQEVAGQHDFPYHGRRPPVHDIQSGLEAGLRMKEKGIEIPPHRRSAIHQEVYQSLSEAESTGSEPSIVRELNEYRSMEDDLATGNLPLHRPRREGEDGRKRHDSERWLRLQELRKKFDDLVGMKPFFLHMNQAVLCVVNAVRDMFDYDTALRKRYPEGDALELRTDEERAVMKTYEDAVEAAWTSFSGRELRRRVNIEVILDNLLALRMQPRLLDWDNRESEPLGCFDEEFDPPHALALLDYQPRPRAAVLANGRSIVRNPFMSILRYHLEDNIIKSLNDIAHGAAEALIPQCPTLKDLHLEHIKVKLLTYEMFAELYAAWEKWPFKISVSRLLQRVVANKELQQL